MDDKKIIEILLKLLKNHKLSDEESEAVHSAIGILSWTKLAQSRLKGMKQKQAKVDELSVSDSAHPRKRKSRK